MVIPTPHTHPSDIYSTQELQFTAPEIKFVAIGGTKHHYWNTQGGKLAWW